MMEVRLMLISFESYILSYITSNIITYFWLNTGDWKLVQGPFMILLK